MSLTNNDILKTMPKYYEEIKHSDERKAKMLSLRKEKKINCLKDSESKFKIKSNSFDSNLLYTEEDCKFANQSLINLIITSNDLLNTLKNIIKALPYELLLNNPTNYKYVLLKLYNISNTFDTKDMKYYKQNIVEGTYDINEDIFFLEIGMIENLFRIILQFPQDQQITNIILKIFINASRDTLYFAKTFYSKTNFNIILEILNSHNNYYIKKEILLLVKNCSQEKCDIIYEGNNIILEKIINELSDHNRIKQGKIPLEYLEYEIDLISYLIKPIPIGFKNRLDFMENDISYLLIGLIKTKIYPLIYPCLEAIISLNSWHNICKLKFKERIRNHPKNHEQTYSIDIVQPITDLLEPNYEFKYISASLHIIRNILTYTPEQKKKTMKVFLEKIEKLLLYYNSQLDTTHFINNKASVLKIYDEVICNFFGWSTQKTVLSHIINGTKIIDYLTVFSKSSFADHNFLFNLYKILHIITLDESVIGSFICKNLIEDIIFYAIKTTFNQHSKYCEDIMIQVLGVLDNVLKVTECTYYENSSWKNFVLEYLKLHDFYDILIKIEETKIYGRDGRESATEIRNKYFENKEGNMLIEN